MAQGNQMNHKEIAEKLCKECFRDANDQTLRIEIKSALDDAYERGRMSKIKVPTPEEIDDQAYLQDIGEEQAFIDGVNWLLEFQKQASHEGEGK